MNATDSVWQPYCPSQQAPWTIERVLHVHRRAGFAATWKEARRDLQEGPDATVSRFLNGNAYLTGVSGRFGEVSQVLADSAVAARNPHRLKAWWMYRMIFSPDPLSERLTLMWHNHFATSNLKIANVRMMRHQNDILRSCALGPFRELLQRATKDAAMLRWLDADSNRREHPNENLARELMELFSMGVGNYTESDVRNVARALTGWTTKNGRFHFDSAHHDAGEKELLNQKGRFNGDDVLRIVLEHPATAKRIAWRLYDHFFGEGPCSSTLIGELSEVLRSNGLNIRKTVDVILRSQLFFAEENIRTRVLGPVEFLVGAVRALEMLDPPPSMIVLSEWAARLGQDLFYPPNVFGWTGGRAWINTRSMIGRAAFANALTSGRLQRPQQPVDTDLLCRHLDHKGFETIVPFACALIANDTTEQYQQRINDAVAYMTTHSPRSVFEATLASPEAQLG